jgi:hypothetical protein
MPLSLSNITHTVSPNLIAATILALPVDAIRRNQLDTIVTTACKRAATQDEAVALLIRIRAAAILFRDLQWLAFMTGIRVKASNELTLVDGIILELIATRPLDASLHFVTDDFCNAMRTRVDAAHLN